VDLFLFVRVLGLGICLLLLLFFFRVVGGGVGRKIQKKQTNKKTTNTREKRVVRCVRESVSLSCVSFFARVCVDFRQPQHRLFEKRGVRVCVFFVLTL